MCVSVCVSLNPLVIAGATVSAGVKVLKMGSGEGQRGGNENEKETRKR